MSRVMGFDLRPHYGLKFASAGAFATLGLAGLAAATLAQGDTPRASAHPAYTPPPAPSWVYVSVMRGGAAPGISAYNATSPATLALSVVRGGATIATATGAAPTAPYARLTGFVPQAGDVLTVSTTDGVRMQTTFDGAPTLDNPSCPPANGRLSGQFSPGVSRFSVKVNTNPYSKQLWGRISANGSAWTATFSRTLPPSGVVTLTEAGTYPQAGNARLSLTSSLIAVYCAGRSGTTAGRPTIQSASFHRRFGLSELLHGGLLVRLMVGDPSLSVSNRDIATVDIATPSGSPPAFATGRQRSKRGTAKILARGVASVSAQGAVMVRVRPTRLGKRVLKGMRSAKVRLVSTIRSPKSGAAQTTYERVTLTARR